MTAYVPRLLSGAARFTGGAEPRDSCVSRSDRSQLLTLPFLCPYLRAGIIASAATPCLCLMCKDDGQVSSGDREDVFSKGRKV